MSDNQRDVPRGLQERWDRAQRRLQAYIDAGGALDTPLHGMPDAEMQASRDGSGRRSEQQTTYTEKDLGKPAPCNQCGRFGVVQREWPSLGDDSPIVALCPDHEHEDDWA